MKLNIKDKFNSKLPADPILENTRRQVTNACFSYVTPKQTSKPELVHVSPEMLHNLGIPEKDAKSDIFLNVFTGNQVLPNTKPYAMCYGGHQFGNWAGQLGDGRAINLCEVEHQSKHWQLQLKGAGETPYSRTADGLAVLRSSIREYLCSEAMFHLGVPTTRALSLALTGDKVLRDVMYDGNPAYEKGAIVCRVAESFLRFGNYQIFAARQDKDTLKTLVDYTINNHFSHLGTPSKATYIQFFKEVSERTLEMIIHWQRVGFVHGVMNTDNMSILGLTIDYGPYGWLEGYEYGWTPNTTDRQHKRYRYGNQPNIGLWNLLQLANALYPLIEEAAPLETILNKYKTDFESGSLNMMRSKIGLYCEEETDVKIVQALEDVLHLTETDMTIFFRNLSSFKTENPTEGLNLINEAFYKPNEIVGNIEKRWNDWFNSYAKRLQSETLSNTERRKKMNAVNPKYVLRNYMAQLAIDAADKGDYKLISELFNMLKKPYDAQPEYDKWFAKRPDWARHKVGCSMLSCSS
ncbi:protein adenylyltransferase SelO [Jejuia pallidilutea]|uniref:Protein nucleotidyltransferase YdiU n=1 Tax=Jejuia pallidilutea TaxID=504487 RepID=A0A098LVQ1_9FLAO|nr:YdiU family protein [Jejuia pallidilutea]GAL90484.1 selenoprotein O and cysteine-containing homologs [Jejuia pallidilutea]